MDSGIEKEGVSVIIPVYNAESYIYKCLDSILAQSYDRWEVIAIDDGSTDGSAAILDDYAARDPRRFKVVHRKNGGAASARNDGIGLASMKYITFVDNDDWIDEGYIATLVDAAEASQAEIVFSGYRRPDNRGVSITQVATLPNSDWGAYVVGAAWAKLYRRDFVLRNKLLFKPYNIGEDHAFTLLAASLAEKKTVLSYIGYNWRYNEASVSNTLQKSSSGLQFYEMIGNLLGSFSARQLELDTYSTHYFVRLIVWFLMYTAKADSSITSSENCVRYIQWLDGELPNWRNNALARPYKPSGDNLPNRVIVWLFSRHPRAFRFLLDVYGRL